MNTAEIDLDRLLPHPGNANRMPEHLFAKLVAHIRASGEYPPLIVRPHPSEPDRYQLIDGHHRARALREIGQGSARCEVWEMDDERATLLLLTLNRLQGSDDPARRGELLRHLAERADRCALHKWLPDARTEIERLIELSEPPPPARPPAHDDLPRAITFFLSAGAYEALVERLAAVSRDRSRALVALLGLNAREPIGTSSERPAQQP